MGDQLLIEIDSGIMPDDLQGLNQGGYFDESGSSLGSVVDEILKTVRVP